MFVIERKDYNFRYHREIVPAEGDLSGVNEATTGGPALLPNEGLLPDRSERVSGHRGYRGDNRYPPPRPHSGFRDRSPIGGGQF